MVADNERVAPFGKDAGQEFTYWRERLLENRVASRINIQLVDLTLYPEQMEQLTRFVNDMRDLLYRLKSDKAGKSEREVEKLDAWAFFEVSELAKKHNALMNKKLSDRFPSLVQYRDKEMPKTKRMKARAAKSEKVVKLPEQAQDV